jgi:hypothetical protein
MLQNQKVRMQTSSNTKLRPQSTSDSAEDSIFAVASEARLMDSDEDKSNSENEGRRIESLVVSGNYFGSSNDENMTLDLCRGFANLCDRINALDDLDEGTLLDSLEDEYIQISEEMEELISRASIGEKNLRDTEVSHIFMFSFLIHVSDLEFDSLHLRYHL